MAIPVVDLSKLLDFLPIPASEVVIPQEDILLPGYGTVAAGEAVTVDYAAVAGPVRQQLFDIVSVFEEQGDIVAETDAPVLDSMVPASGEQGEEITLAGERFTDMTAFLVDAEGVETEVDNLTIADDENATFDVPDIEAGTYALKLVLSTGFLLVPGAFTDETMIPVFTSVTPDSAEDGDSITLAGESFAPELAVFVVTGPETEVEVDNLVVNSDLEAVFDIPTVDAGEYPLKLVNPDGEIVTETAVLSVHVLPTFTSITPATGAPTDSIALVGTGFDALMEVKVVDALDAETDVDNLVITDAANAAFDIPAVADGAYKLKLVNPYGGVLTTGDELTVATP